MSVKVLERQAYRTPLAVMCVDGVSGITVSDALVVTAWRQADQAGFYTARRSPLSGIHSFGNLPGLWSYSHRVLPAGGPGTWPAFTPEAWSVSVVDTASRYLPVAVLAQVPVSAPITVPLSSAPSRTVGDAIGVVRGEIHDAGSGDPLGWALVRIDDGSAVYQTVADELGRFRVQAPYPQALPPLAGSPPSGPGITSVSWPLTISVRSQPAALVWPAGTHPPDPPYLSSITNQATAQLVDGAPMPSLAESLQFGLDLVLALQAVPA